MMENGLRHKYQVAEYFGVTPQALSIWIAKNQIPPKHLLKLSLELVEQCVPTPLFGNTRKLPAIRVLDDGRSQRLRLVDPDAVHLQRPIFLWLDLIRIDFGLFVLRMIVPG